MNFFSLGMADSSINMSVVDQAGHGLTPQLVYKRK
jgi:hypothetical protein